MRGFEYRVGVDRNNYCEQLGDQIEFFKVLKFNVVAANYNKAVKMFLVVLPSLKYQEY